MFEYLKAHPSIFIIGATFIIIVLIFAFFRKKQSQKYAVETPPYNQINQNEYVELQNLSNETSPRPDETDTEPITPLPAPKLTKKLRYDTGNQPRKSPHIYDTPRATEFPAIPESVTDESSSSFSYVPAEILQQGTSTSANTGRQPVVYRYRQQSIENKENRVSISDVYKHGSYISFDGEFDQFDEFRKSSINTMRLTVDFGASNANYIVPVVEEEF